MMNVVINSIKKQFFNNEFMWIYFIGILLFTLIVFYLNGFNFSKIKLLLITITIIIGSILIYYSSKSKKEIHKIAFLYLLIFGLIIAFTTPIFIVADETEHFARSDLTSEGILIPEYTPNKGYYMNNYFWDMLYKCGSTALNTNFTHTGIRDAQGYFESVFSQNLFYAYIAQAIGILFAKLLNLSMIWTLWLGRIFNLILYSSIASFAIKKANKYKYTLLFLSCLPLAVFQASSMSADAFIFAMGILNISYFIRMYSSENNINKKDLSIFIISGLLMGLLKIPYIFILLLIFILPKDKFESKKICNIFYFVSIVLIGVTMLYTLKYSSHQLLNSGRLAYIMQNNISTSNQINYMLHKPLDVALTFIVSIGGSFYTVFIQELSFYHLHYVNGQYLFNIILFIVFFIVALSSPIKFEKKERIYLLLIFLVMYISTFLTQYLSWTPIGYDSILGIQARYFIPILAFIPLIIGRDYYKQIDNYKNIILMLVPLVLTGMIILTMINFY